MANKTILYRAKDAIAAISYSGIAYIGGKPTDEWLSECLWGSAFQRGPDGNTPAAIGLQVRPNDWDIDTAISAVRSAVNNLSQQTVNAGGMFVELAGWREDRPLRPFIVEVERPPGATVVRISGSPRRILRRRNFFLGQIGTQIPWAIIDRAFARYRTGGVLLSSDTEKTFVALIRKASFAHHVIGPDILSISIPVPDTGPIEVKFHAMRLHLARLITAAAAIDLEVAHTPWILGLNSFRAPQMVLGDINLCLDGIPVVLKAPPGKGNIKFLSSAIKRPKA